MNFIIKFHKYISEHLDKSMSNEKEIQIIEIVVSDEEIKSYAEKEKYDNDVFNVEEELDNYITKYHKNDFDFTVSEVIK